MRDGSVNFKALLNGIKDGKEYQSVNYVGFISLLIYEVKKLKVSVKEIQEKI